MLRSRNINRWKNKQRARGESQSGWDENTGTYHIPRRTNKYVSRGKMRERKSFGRHPNSSYLK